MAFIVAVFLLLSLVQQELCIENNDLRVQTTSGIVEGDRIKAPDGTDVLRFLGIPYAEAPIGPLRFRPPIKKKESKDVIKANYVSKSCFQVVNEETTVEWLLSPRNLSEDCLFLNIWTPSPKPTKAAVLFSIHGGGFQAGTANMLFFGDVLATQDVIFVSLNYRTNVLGFLYFDPEEIPGNVGLMDQALALQWVQDNIANFGGDPQKVTVWGCSAGGASVGHHLLIPSSRGLFQRAVLQSGYQRASWSSSDIKFAMEQTEKFIKLMGCDSSHRMDVINCLRSKNPRDLVKNATTVYQPLSQFAAFIPVIDGYYYPKNRSEDVTDKNINVMLGFATDDTMLLLESSKSNLGTLTDDSFITENQFSAFVNEFFAIGGNEVADAVKKAYVDSVEQSNWRRAVADFPNDYIFACNAADSANHLANNNNQVYLYQYDYKMSFSFVRSWAGASHCDEKYFIFDKLIGDNITSDDLIIQKKLMNYYTQFAKNGNPNYGSIPEWPQYTEKDKSFLNINVKDTVKHGVRTKRCHFIHQELPPLLRKYKSM